MKKILKLIFLCSIFYSCKEQQLCLSPDNVYPSPYKSPTCNPNGKVVMFEHMPVSTKFLKEGINGCPSYYYYEYKEDSLGLWVVNTNGKDMRRVYSRRLGNCTWSPDGKKLAFGNGKISYMNFDGLNLDTTNIYSLNTSGSGYNPTWNSIGDKICYTQTAINDSLTPGIYIYDLTTKKSEQIAKYGNYSCWSVTSDSIYFISSNSIYNYCCITKDIKLVKAIDSPNSNIHNLKISHNGKLLFFNSTSTKSNEIQLYRIDTNGNKLIQLSQNGCEHFSTMPDGRIVYVNYQNNYIDDKSGTLWIMDSDGNNKQQLTYNTFKTR